MTRTTKLFHVGTGCVSEGEDIENYSSHNILATSAEDAIRKAKKRFSKGEYAETVSIVGHVDE